MGLIAAGTIPAEGASGLVDAGKIQALRGACARDAGLRQRLEQSPEEVLREHGLAPGRGTDVVALVRAILASELSEAELAAAAGGFEHVWEPMP
jgi:hypothetical protein